MVTKSDIQLEFGDYEKVCGARESTQIDLRSSKMDGRRAYAVTLSPNHLRSLNRLPSKLHNATRK